MSTKKSHGLIPQPPQHEGILKATQLCFPGIRDACNIIRMKMIDAKIPYADDGATRAALGFIIALFKQNGGSRKNLIAVVNEVWPWFELQPNVIPPSDQDPPKVLS